MIFDISVKVFGQMSGQFKKPKKKIEGAPKIFFKVKESPL